MTAEDKLRTALADLLGEMKKIWPGEIEAIPLALAPNGDTVIGEVTSSIRYPALEAARQRARDAVLHA